MALPVKYADTPLELPGGAVRTIGAGSPFLFGFLIKGNLVMADKRASGTCPFCGTKNSTEPVRRAERLLTYSCAHCQKYWSEATGPDFMKAVNQLNRKPDDS